MGRILFVLAVALGIYYFWPKPIHYPLVHLPTPPLQAPLTSPQLWEVNEHALRGLATYHIEALVLSTQRYRYDALAKVSPVDFALGWGPMADRNELKQLKIWQSGRWFNYSWPEDVVPLATDKIVESSANTHMIPINKYIEKLLLSVKAGEVIKADGYLVEVTGPNAFSVKSSLSRTDTNGGACEIFLVEYFDIVR